MFLSAEDISRRIYNSSAPVLFFDTCIFLDILRSPYRDNIHVDAISSVLSLLKMTGSDPCKLWLLTNELVLSEWNDNIATVKQELEKEIKHQEYIRDQLIIAASVALRVDHPHGQKMTSLNLHEHLESLSRNFLSRCLVIKQEDSHAIKAMCRVTGHLAPAKQGKSEPKDCLIFEAFLDVSARLRKLNYSGKIFFVTSNSKDYGKANNPFISEELNNIKAVLIDSLPYALAVVRD